MNLLILDGTREYQLEGLNATGDPARQLQPVRLDETRSGLNADLLQDCAAGQTWEHYGTWLHSLPMGDVVIPQPPGL